MSEEFKIVRREKPPWGIIGGGINDYNLEKAGTLDERNLCYLVQTQADEVVGGLIGATYWDWFYINLMWVREDLRGQGFGGKLLTNAEEEAVRRGAKNAYLDTFSFQAPEFYEKHGYLVFGELADFPPGHQRFFMKKEL
ncbi:MAG: GNAT family N-acetyltransferase [Chloroflexota bacterium]